ncbi:MAG: bifunctional diguanylate cyclase/phosphodiesterase [Pseudomonadales bacterium]|nr:bifunctional diguanylate cyclase/phosphodiesterase [Pseudomonadales bacterium]MCP5357838.1 bifunctional diguanylate cyclase/phosphodiesterase [Pseudomonadales bacterium]
MRILLIAEHDVEFRLVERLLNSIDGTPHQLSWCQADVGALAALPVSSYELILWGRISEAPLSRALLTELKRQQSAVPVIAIVDHFPPNADRDAIRRGESDILLRSALNADILQRAIAFTCARSTPSIRNIETLNADPLTGLSNRQEFRTQLARILADAKTSESVGLILIDVDQFKKVNASYGQGAGDALIQLIASRIRESLREPLCMARVGGNEFAVVFRDEQGQVETECRRGIDDIVQSMTKPFAVAQHAIRMNVSIGVALNKEITITVDALLANADVAMRIAKSEKGNNFQFYSREMTDAQQKLLKLESEIRRSIRNEEFELYYQPRIDINSHRIVGAEGLVRWNHPTRGVLPPSEFIAVAEDCGLIVPLGYWIIHQACKDLNRLSEVGHHELQLAVNVSFKQFQDRNFVQTVANILGNQGITEGRLEFELTETTMMSEGHAVDQSLRRLSELGIDISLDDFGTGYSSFAHIQRLPISVLKIDRSFVGSVTSNEDDATIVKAIINLAHSLNMQVIAEGAETAEQVEFLNQNRCDQVQGFYFSKPVKFHALLDLLNSESVFSGADSATIQNVLS